MTANHIEKSDMSAGLPATFPARMNGQLAIVAIAPPWVKWHPAPAEFSATRLDGQRFAIGDITDLGVTSLGEFKTLAITANDRTIRMYAAAELVDRVADYLSRSPG